MRAAGLVLDDVQSTHVTGWIDLGREHHQPWGLIHGGVYTTAIEIRRERRRVDRSARPRAGRRRRQQQHQLPPFDDRRSGDVDARAIQQGRTQQLWEVRITDDRDRLVATGQVRLQNITPRT